MNALVLSARSFSLARSLIWIVFFLLFGVAVGHNGSTTAAANEPHLTIDRAGTTVVIGWPASSPGAHLESRRQHPGNWAPVSSKPRLIDGRLQLITGCTEVGEFYRLVCDQPESCGCLEDPTQAVFVARPPFGNDTNSGSNLSPVATLAKALQLASAAPQKNRVYVAKGTYLLAAPLELVPGISLYGQFDGTTNWTRSVENTTVISGSTTAITAHALNLETHVEGFTILSADAAAPGESSYGIRVTGGSHPLFIRFNTIIAGAGAPGSNGSSGAAGLAGGPGGQGKDGRMDGGDGGRKPGLGGASSCGLNGGEGGWGGIRKDGFNGLPGAGWSGVAGAPGAPGPGGPYTRSGSGNNGFDGLKGADGNHGSNVPPVVRLGSLSLTGYVPALGTAGLPGVDGGGGGGGGGGAAAVASEYGGTSYWANGGGGGGGGGGGCRGGAGEGGAGGGGSFCLFVFDAEVQAVENRFQPSQGGGGGDGGKGGLGGAGGPGGIRGGAIKAAGKGGYGGAGGSGGAAGCGSGGPGGPAIGIVWSSSSRLALADNEFQIGAGGDGGHGGSNTVSGAAADGLSGVSVAILAVPGATSEGSSGQLTFPGTVPSP
jgi:hypothetical protein